MREPVFVDDVDNHQLDKESVMEAIRYNGYVPDADENWITIMVQGELYVIDPDRFPIMTIMKPYSLDHNKRDMNLLHMAAQQVSDELIMAKVIFTGEHEDGIAFQLVAIENKYGHFKDCLTKYISIIEEAHTRTNNIYNDLVEKNKELSLLPQPGSEKLGEKKIML